MEDRWRSDAASFSAIVALPRRAVGTLEVPRA
jgi:hypothetical protein